MEFVGRFVKVSTISLMELNGRIENIDTQNQDLSLSNIVAKKNGKVTHIPKMTLNSKDIAELKIIDPSDLDHLLANQTQQEHQHQQQRSSPSTSSPHHHHHQQQQQPQRQQRQQQKHEFNDPAIISFKKSSPSPPPAPAPLSRGTSSQTRFSGSSSSRTRTPRPVSAAGAGGWAHVNVNDVHDTDFDFQANLEKFDKSVVFAEYHKSSSSPATSRPPSSASSKPKLVTLPSSAAFVTSKNIRVPSATPLQMAEAERLASEEFGVTSEMLTTHASRSIAEMVFEIFADHTAFQSPLPGSTASAGAASPPRLLFLLGNHRLGISTLSAALLLSQRGYLVTLIVPASDPVPALQHVLGIAKRASLACFQCVLEVQKRKSAAFDLVIDALLGVASWTEIRSEHEREVVSEWITFTHTARTPILSVDVPSGLDATTGHSLFPNLVVVPNWTLCLGIPKAGLIDPHVTGRVYLADVGLPSGVWKKVGVQPWPSASPFAHAWVVQLHFPGAALGT